MANDSTPVQDGSPLAGIIALIVLIAITTVGILGYNILNNQPQITVPKKENSSLVKEEKIAENKDEPKPILIEEQAGSTTKNDSNGGVSEDIKPVEQKTSDVNTKSEEIVEKKDEVKTIENNKPVENKTEVPSADTKIIAKNSYGLNDYTFGDIKQGQYTVRDGDTLWEISEGVYGDGFQWVKIVSNNSSFISSLPNGEMALILTGQTLML